MSKIALCPWQTTDRRLDRDAAPAADCDAEVGLGQGRRVVDPVPDHHDLWVQESKPVTRCERRCRSECPEFESWSHDNVIVRTTACWRCWSSLTFALFSAGSTPDWFPGTVFKLRHQSSGKTQGELVSQVAVCPGQATHRPSHGRPAAPPAGRWPGHSARCRRSPSRR